MKIGSMSLTKKTKKANAIWKRRGIDYVKGKYFLTARIFGQMEKQLATETL